MVRTMLGNVERGVRRAALALWVLGLAWIAMPAAPAQAGKAEPLTVGAGKSLVIEMPNEVSTVSIADSKVADAAVGSERSVVLNGKAPGKTSLVVWEENGHFTLYDVTVTNQASKPQVLMQVKISELNLQKVKEMGFDWTAFLRDAKHLDGAISGGLFVTKVETPFNPPLIGPETDGFAAWRRGDGNANFLTTFRMLEENGAAKTLASPNLVATSGDSAAFLAGGEFPVPIARSATETGTTVTIEWKEYGISLKAIPTVLDNDRIRLYIAPEVSAPDYSHSVLLNGYEVPGVTTRRVGTTVEMGSGDVLVIGGVKNFEKQKTTRKFPILGDVPLLKFLFSYKKTELRERDLVIAVTPSLVTDLARSFPTLPTDEPKEDEREGSAKPKQPGTSTTAEAK